MDNPIVLAVFFLIWVISALHKFHKEIEKKKMALEKERKKAKTTFIKIEKEEKTEKTIELPPFLKELEKMLFPQEVPVENEEVESKKEENVFGEKQSLEEYKEETIEEITQKPEVIVSEAVKKEIIKREEKSIPIFLPSYKSISIPSKFFLNAVQIKKGVLLAEILGLPLAKRKRRIRNLLQRKKVF